MLIKLFQLTFNFLNVNCYVNYHHLLTMMASYKM